MLFILILLAWLTMQLWGGATLFHRDEYFAQWQHWLGERYSQTLGDTGTIITLLLIPVFILALVLHLFGGWFFGLLGVLINLAVLLYSCGRGDYFSRLEAYRDSFNHGVNNNGTNNHSANDADQESNDEAVFRVAERQFFVRGSSLAEVHSQVRQQLAYQAYERWFAVVFWFVLLGAPGALLYRVCQLAAKNNNSQALEPDLQTEADGSEASDTAFVGENNARVLLGFMDWLPARLWGFAYAMCGDFSVIMQILSTQMFAKIPALALIEKFNLATIYPQRFDAELPTIESNDRLEIKKEIDMIRNMNHRVMVLSIVAIAIVTILV